MSDFTKSCVYQIYPKSYCDTTGNGMGDLNGVTQKLDYLKELGVDYIWLTPFFVSPQKDNGYDVQDYYHIDPLYGTMEDLDRLIAEAKDRGIGLMFDMVFNHTSTYHEWFQKALQGDPKYKDYYIFKKGKHGKPPTNWQSKFGGNAWEYVEKLDAYYLHLFDKTQADLNWENEEVREEMKQILLYWKKKGIRGFRFDVINLISKPDCYEDDQEGDGKRFYTDGTKVHQYLREMVEDTGLDAEDMITVGEMSATTIDHCIQYTNPAEKQLKMCFNFHHLKVDYKDGNKWSLMPYDFMKMKELFQTWQVAMAKHHGWNAVFWCNHDQPRALSRFGDDGRYRKQSAKMLALAIHGMRGTPYIYQGEEIGMTNAYFTSIDQYRDVESTQYYEILRSSGIEEKEVYHILGERSRDNSRTPMQWDGSERAGFTEGVSWIDINPNSSRINVEESQKDQDSIFYFYQKLIRLRKEYEVIRSGDYIPMLEDDHQVLAYGRKGEGEDLIVLADFSGQGKTVDLGTSLTEYQCLADNYGQTEVIGSQVQLLPYGAVMLYRKTIE